MKKNKNSAPTLYEVLYKAYKWKNGLGGPLSTEEQNLLTAWSELSPTNTVLAGRLTAVQSDTSSDKLDWFFERQRIGYYELVIRRYFKDIHPDKIARDHEIIWIMTEFILTEVESPDLKIFAEWAKGSSIHKAIHKRFWADRREKLSETQREQHADAAWQRFEREYYTPFNLAKVWLIKLYKRLYSLIVRR
jgi:hypothetical protein